MNKRPIALAIAAVLIAAHCGAEQPPEETASIHAVILPARYSGIVSVRYSGASSVAVRVEISTGSSTRSRSRYHREGKWHGRATLRGSGFVDVKVFSRKSGHLIVAKSYGVAP